MKKYVKVILLGLFLILPFSVKAQVKEVGDIVYSIQSKKIEDYMCSSVKGHDLFAETLEDDKMVVYDVTGLKTYLLDLKNPGSCNEFDVDKHNPLLNEYIYVWEENKDLYLYTYDVNSRSRVIKSTDTTLDVNSIYFELNEDGYFHYLNEKDLDLQKLNTYYEAIMLEIANNDYNSNETYYEIINEKNQEVSEVTFDENKIYEKGKYFIESKPIKKELIGKNSKETYVAPKEKTGLSKDITFKRRELLWHIALNGKNYIVFLIDEENVNARAIFDTEGNYQTFGYDKLLVEDLSDITHGEYLSLVVSQDKKKNVILDKNLNEVYSKEFTDNYDILYLLGPYDNTVYLVNQGGYSKEFIGITKYYLISGKNQTFKDNDLTFIFSGDFNKLSSVKVNDKELKEDSYTKKSGSTIITLNKNYLSTLANGTYTLKVEYNDGGYVKTDFVIKNEEKLEENTTKEGTTTKPSNNEEVPKTFDNLQISILVALLSFVCLLGTTMFLKKD